jgi:hypothetical protein
LCRVVWKKCANVAEVLAASIALMMETADTSETLENLYQTTRRNNPEDHLHTGRRENLKIPRFNDWLQALLAGWLFCWLFYWLMDG